jgi:hypothetical protein
VLFYDWMRVGRAPSSGRALNESGKGCMIGSRNNQDDAMQSFKKRAAGAQQYSLQRYTGTHSVAPTD